MRIKDVPISPAYLVWHDAFDNGAMDVYPQGSFETAQKTAEERNERNAQTGNDDAGIWRAYTKLPRVKVYKFHPEENRP